MKKNPDPNRGRELLLKKLSRVMKLYLLILIVTISSVSASVYSQNTRLTLKMENATIAEVFDAIEKQSDFFFFYNKEQTNDQQRVSVNVKDVKIDEILSAVFGDKSVNYEIIGKNIIIKPRETSDNDSAQQGGKITGKVTDSGGVPIVGVSVVVKGTTMGVTTNNDGSYNFSLPRDAKILVFSFVGMKSQEIVIGNQSVINVVLADESIGLEEVVAIGYGTQKKNAVTGAVSTAKLDEYKMVPVNNVLETVKGTIPGLNVGGTNTAGGEAGMTIRGQKSQAAGSSPLIIVDGAVFSGTISDISPNDIESFTVLKDASAAAVYGSRSANGVILIETKRGTGIDGKPRFEVKSSYGISNELEALKVYDAKGYLQRLLDIRSANGLEADPAKVDLYMQVEEQKNYRATPDHKPTLEDPHSLFSQMGHAFNTSVSVSNRTEKSRYFISANIIRQKGVILNDEYKSLTGRINIDSDLTSWFNLGIKSNYSLRDYSGSSIYGMGTSASGSSPNWFSPYASLFNDDGTYKQFPQTTTSFNNPFWQMATEDLDKRNSLNAVISAVIKVPWVKGLSYNATYSNTLNWSNRYYFYDKNTLDGLAKAGTGQRGINNTYSTMMDNIIKYNNTFSQKHNVDLTLLYSYEHTVYDSQVAYAESFDNAALGTYRLQDGKIQKVSTGGGETTGFGKMARGTYTYDNKYSLTGTIRTDGYSGFSKNKKWGTFPSVGVNWNISKEGFMKNIKPIDNIALRASYGSNGNQSVAAYSTLAKMASSKYLFYNDASYAFTQYISTLANDDLGWESTTGLNLGVDFSVLKSRIKGSVDAYQTATHDLMFSLPLPRASGKSSITSNIGEIQNKGLEFNLSTLNVKRANFNWTSDVSFSINRNKVVTILGPDPKTGIEADLISAGYFIGRSLGTIYTYKVTGMWQQADKDAAAIMTGMLPGSYKLEDVNNDGKITSDQDRQFIGNSKENFRWSLTNNFKYKELSLMVYLYSIWGGNGYYLSGSNTPYNDGYANNGAMNHSIFDYWTPTNPGAMFPRPNVSSAAYRGVKYFDRSFIKLQKISLTYDFTKIVKPWGLQGLNCSLSADNLFTYAPHWVGLDPETNNGLTDTSIPSIRTYLFSVALNF